MFTQLTATTKAKPALGWGIFIVAMVGVFLLGLLAASITQRRAEVATLYNNRPVQISGIEARNELWKPNFPRQYETWRQTERMDFESKYLGNQFRDELEHRPNMVVLWAGYAFSKDYNAPRGHMHALDDNRNTLRTGTPRTDTDGPMSASCWACKSPDVPRLMAENGIAEFYQNKWGALGSEIVNPIGCASCHNPVDMSLTIMQPALVEALERQGRDITQATQQEMRSLVCAQCHVEYYMKPGTNYLTFPWDRGMTLEAAEEYYDNLNFSDFTHAISRTPIIKAQHPDYELFLLGTHGQRGVSCADCHMPYISEGGIKFSDHHLMSPLQNISASCGTCHRDSEENLRGYVEFNQDRVVEIRNRLEPELVRAHIMAGAAWEHGASEEEMAPVLQLIRQAQWRWDYGVASHGAPFHAPVETQRILSHGLDRAMQAQLALQQILFAHGVTEVPMPDLSTKESAQAYIGFNWQQARTEKDEWIRTVVPEWLRIAAENGRL